MIVLYLACFPITVLCHVLCTVLSLIAVTVGFLPLIEASATLNHTATSGCVGDHLMFNCSVTNTSSLKWLFGENGDEITFKYWDPVSSQGQVRIDRNGITTLVIANLTYKMCRPSNLCSMESWITVPVRSDEVNFQLLCQSADNDSKTIIITTNGEYNA